MATSSSLSTNSELDITKTERIQDTLPCILDGRFFIYCETESTDNKKVAICTSCRPKEVKICGFYNCTSNFVTHLKRKHGDNLFKEYQSYLKSVRQSKKSSRTTDHRRLPETRYRRDVSIEQSISSRQFDENIVKFFIHSMIPLQVIDDPYFKKIFDGFNTTENGSTNLSRQALKSLINDYYINEISDVKKELHSIKDVSTTAEIWWEKSCAFLGVTAQWLDSNLKRRFKTVACQQFSDTYSYNRIALLLKKVHAEFNLDSEKVLAKVTDSGNYFMEAFKEFGVDMESCVNFTSNTDDNSDSEDSAIIQEDSHYEVRNSMLHSNTLNDVGSLATVEHIPQSIIEQLPAHLVCCAHKLNLCATDANKEIQNNETTAQIQNQVAKKCNNLWILAGHSKAATIIHNILGHNLSKPDITRWSSLNDALKQIALIQEKNVQLHAALGLKNALGDSDFLYINEYLRCSKPIADALDILHDENDMYYGILLPCLVSLRKKLQKLNTESFIYCKKLAETYLESLEERFAELFDFSSNVAQNAAIAAMSYPRFKDKWLACIDIKHHSCIKSMFKAAIIKVMHEIPNTLHDTTKNRSDDNYFEFDSDSSLSDSEDKHLCVDAIISHYLADQDRDISMLDKYPKIKMIFKKYNTPLPSAPIERLFSYTTMINLPKLRGFSDEMIEKRLLLKSNLNHT